jgi:hypothetical protein
MKRRRSEPCILLPEGLAIPDVHAKSEGVHRYAERAGLHGHLDGTEDGCRR